MRALRPLLLLAGLLLPLGAAAAGEVQRVHNPDYGYGYGAPPRPSFTPPRPWWGPPPGHYAPPPVRWRAPPRPHWQRPHWQHHRRW